MRRRPRWYYLVAALLTLWGLAGCFACFQQIRLGAEAMGPASAYDRAVHASLPVWYNQVYAATVGFSAAGGIALLALRRSATLFFAVSLLAVAVQFGWLFATTDIVAHKGAAVVLPFPILIVAVGLFALWFARRARRRGWTR
ncbi:hypothetical protein [Sphingomonas aracearum]|uniref:Sugar transporter n=1 Tax=Sphingomonas aracearum TaxID=2283317 RepID=A0A369VSZ8_9SPHN|nr:hypothetical protein [Sphingomonas aracearum]RDE05508.1 hypothetical protein DVW87_09720 [Sphingomonas aracearum]